MKRGHGFARRGVYLTYCAAGFHPIHTTYLHPYYYSFLGKKVAFSDLAMRIIACTLRSTSSSVVAHEETEIRIAFDYAAAATLEPADTLGA